jgi:hypothetical protein
MQIDNPVKLRAVEINPWEDPRWEAFVAGHPDGTIYHHPTWLKALEREYKQRTAFLACEDPDGAVLGILPLLYTRGFPFRGKSPNAGPRLSSLPRTPMAGPLSVDAEATSELLREARRRAAADPRVRLQIKAHCGELRGESDDVVKKPWRQCYVVHLPGIRGQEYKIPNSQNRATIKRGINKAISKGVGTRMADKESDLLTWYEFYLETMRRNLVPARPYRFFKALWELMRPTGTMRLVLAEHQTEAGTRIIGGHIFFFFGQTVTYAFGASRSADFSLRPNDTILWEAIQNASMEGYRFVDLGEVPDGDDDLARFKIKWGAEAVQLYRYYYPDFPVVEPAVEENKYSPMKLASALWRHMPLSMTAWVGDRIFGYL